MSDVAETLQGASDDERLELMELLGVENPDDLQGTLEQFVAEEFGVDAEQVVDAERTGWNIRDHVDGDPADAMNLADWAARKHTAAMAKAEQVNEIADQQINQILRWRNKMVERQEQTAGFFRYLLAQYFADFHADETSIELPGGVRLRMKKNQARIVWDEETALAFVRENNIVEALKEALQKTPLKETLDKQSDGSFVYRDTGEVVGFVHMEEPEEERTFEVV